MTSLPYQLDAIVRFPCDRIVMCIARNFFFFWVKICGFLFCFQTKLFRFITWIYALLSHFHLLLECVVSKCNYELRRCTFSGWIYNRVGAAFPLRTFCYEKILFKLQLIILSGQRSRTTKRIYSERKREEYIEIYSFFCRNKYVVRCTLVHWPFLYGQ